MRADAGYQPTTPITADGDAPSMEFVIWAQRILRELAAANARIDDLTQRIEALEP